jgi:hypothetical protein
MPHSPCDLAIGHGSAKWIYRSLLKFYPFCEIQRKRKLKARAKQAQAQLSPCFKMQGLDLAGQTQRDRGV